MFPGTPPPAGARLDALAIEELATGPSGTLFCLMLAQKVVQISYALALRRILGETFQPAGGPQASALRFERLQIQIGHVISMLCAKHIEGGARMRQGGLPARLL